MSRNDLPRDHGAAYMGSHGSLSVRGLWTMFNLTRHSHHHAEGEVPYHELRSYPDAPMMVNGCLATIILAMIPPLGGLARRR